METKRRIKRKRIMAVMIGILVVITCIILGSQIVKISAKARQLEKREQRLQELLSYQKLRQQLIEDEEAYSLTLEYIEEKAKSIGYVYPDEIIFKKAD